MCINEQIQSRKICLSTYTTPNERITINQEEISDSEIFEYYNKFRHLDLGFFDFFFLIAMQYFYDKCWYCNVEVGIGGRFDTKY